MKECKKCGTLYPDNYKICPTCACTNYKDVIRKTRYVEVNDKTGREEELLMAVAGDCKFDIESV